MLCMGLSTQRDDKGLLWVEFTPEGHRPPLLTPAIFDSMQLIVGEAEQNPPAGMVFVGQQGGDFQAGIDLDKMEEIGSRRQAVEASRSGQLLFQRIADLPCPTVAAIEGRCIGGGLELSMACSARIAAETRATVLVLPEIHLGIVCGYGGTQRLPRLIGQQRALRMILTGQAVGAAKAFAWGLVDRIAAAEMLRAEAVRLVDDLLEGRPARQRPRRGVADWILDRTPLGRRVVRNRFRKVVLAKTGGHFPAAEKMIEAVGYSADGIELKRGLELEAEMLGELVAGDVHRHMLRLVRSRQALRRPRGRDPASGQPQDLAQSLQLPEPVASTLREVLTDDPGGEDGAAEPGEAPPLETSDGVGLLRRLPNARLPSVIEVAWLSPDGEPAAVEAGGPGGFQDLARHLVTAAGCCAVYCGPAGPSPGLNLVAAYLREGDRLVAEGWERDRVDRILEEWGMERGPFSFSSHMGEEWTDRLEGLPSRRLASATPPPDPDSTPETDAIRLVEEVAAVLVLEMSRLWKVVDEPVEAGWLILDVFTLGGPSFCGGVLGAARKLGAGHLAERLRPMEQRWGEVYRAGALVEGGLLSPAASRPADGRSAQEL